MAPMKTRCALALIVLLAVTPTRAAGPTIAIDATSVTGKVSPLFYGLMTEEINHAYDGGLYAELVRNRAFLDDAQSPAHWAVVQGSGAAATIALDPAQPLNQAIPTSLRLDVTQATRGHAAGVANEGYWGIPIKPNTRYRASLYAKAAPGSNGPVTLSLQSEDGATTYATGTIAAGAPGSTRIFTCSSGLPSAAKAAGTPSTPQVPVIIGVTSISPSAIARNVSPNSNGS